MTFFIVVPSCAGDLLMVTPAASRAAILSVALPLPPEMIAPAWPMRRPGGAVKPVISQTRMVKHTETVGRQQSKGSQHDRIPWPSAGQTHAAARRVGALGVCCSSRQIVTAVAPRVCGLRWGSLQLINYLVCAAQVTDGMRSLTAQMLVLRPARAADKEAVHNCRLSPTQHTPPPNRTPPHPRPPAMKDTTGFCVPLALMNSAASSSAVPPISPIMMMPSVCVRMLVLCVVCLGGGGEGAGWREADETQKGRGGQADGKQERRVRWS